jgi:hypothetical protein
MKKHKFLISIFAIVATLAVSIFASCGVDDVSQKIKEIRCEHKAVESEIITDATCYSVGKEQKTCFDCGKVWTTDIDKIEHVWSEGLIKSSATCENDAVYYCSCTSIGCSESKDVVRVGSALGHTDSDCDFLCDLCNIDMIPSYLVKAEVGELVAGNTYYFYPDNAPNQIIFETSSNDSYIYMDLSNGSHYIWHTSTSGPLFKLEGLARDYIGGPYKITFTEGSYAIIKGSDGTPTGDYFVVDKNTTITELNGRIYRVVE